MSWRCERCGTSNSDERYDCSKCKNFNPHVDAGHVRWNDWTCTGCGEDNGGAFRSCGKCGMKRPS